MALVKDETLVPVHGQKTHVAPNQQLPRADTREMFLIAHFTLSGHH